ncbi:MAG: TatD family deoxyribonuclease [Candidatus Dadabacteria bacterium]|nr:MAG: TatD family deoxyribonuclease [Candidatus Dadabacteria bacterium]
MLVDTHCHLADEAFDSDRPAVVERARRAGVTRIVAVGGGGPIEHSEKSAALAAADPAIRATAGIHPHDAAGYDDAVEARIEKLLAKPEVVAVGETGLDFYYENSPRAAQRAVLARQLALAERYRLPVVLHCRNAEAELLDVLRAERQPPIAGVVHCFTGDYETARRYLDLGLCISLTGIITFKKATALREVVRRLPLERIMVETDAPYLAPEPHRGRRNEPAHVALIARFLAELTGRPFEEVAATTTAVAERLFFRPGANASHAP